MKVLFILVLTMFSFNVMAETKIKITLDSGEEILATINDTKTSRDLLSRLPLNITMTDLFGREKYYNFNEPLENSEKKEYTYNKGDIFYWPPQHSFVIIYRQDNDTIPNGMPQGKEFVRWEVTGLELTEEQKTAAEVEIVMPENAVSFTAVYQDVAEPTPEPTAEPTPEPTAKPTPAPTAKPTAQPTQEPQPTPEATAQPVQPTAQPENKLPATGDAFPAVLLMTGLCAAVYGVWLLRSRRRGQ